MKLPAAVNGCPVEKSSPKANALIITVTPLQNKLASTSKHRGTVQLALVGRLLSLLYVEAAATTRRLRRQFPLRRHLITTPTIYDLRSTILPARSRGWTDHAPIQPSEYSSTGSAPRYLPSFIFNLDTSLSRIQNHF